MTKELRDLQVLSVNLTDKPLNGPFQVSQMDEERHADETT